VLHGEHVATEALQKTSLVHNIVPWHDRVYGCLRLLHAEHQERRSQRLLGKSRAGLRYSSLGIVRRDTHVQLRYENAGTLEKCKRSVTDTGALPVALRVHVDGRHVDHSLDHDRGIIPNRDPRDCPLHQLLHGELAHVRCATELQKPASLPGR